MNFIYIVSLIVKIVSWCFIEIRPLNKKKGKENSSLIGRIFEQDRTVLLIFSQVSEDETYGDRDV